MKASCVECGASLLTDQTENASIVYQCGCTDAPRGERHIRIKGRVVNGRLVLRDELPDVVRTVTA